MICANCHSENIIVTEFPPYKGWDVTMKYCGDCRSHDVMDDKLEIRRLKLEKIKEQI